MVSSLRTLSIASCAAFSVVNFGSMAAPPPSLRGRETTTSINYSSWMGQYSDKTLQELVIPGSHDAAAYKTQDQLPLFIDRWVLTQDKTIYDQLMSGVRFLDIRLTYRNGELWTAHRFQTASFVEVSDDVLRFVSENPSEVVIIKLQADSHIDDTIRTLFDPTGEEARITMEPFLADLVRVAVPPTMARLTVGHMTRAGLNVVLLEGEGRSIPKEGKLWPWTLMATRWHNAQFGASLCKRLIDNTEWAQDNTLNIYQVQITPSSETILQGSAARVFGDLAGAAASVRDTVLLPWLETLDGSFSGIIGHDFVGDADVMKSIIEVNSRPIKKKNYITEAVNSAKICQTGTCFDNDDCKGMSNSRCETAPGPSLYTCASPDVSPFGQLPSPGPLSFFRGFRFGPL